jgi:hypothetical protein
MRFAPAKLNLGLRFDLARPNIVAVHRLCDCDLCDPESYVW